MFLTMPGPSEFGQAKSSCKSACTTETVRAGDRQYGYEILEKGAVGMSAEENLKLMLHDARNSFS